jgi:hypothetical protein
MAFKRYMLYMGVLRGRAPKKDKACPVKNNIGYSKKEKVLGYYWRKPRSCCIVYNDD